MAIRNHGGHFTYCNYGDWYDFSKCRCAEGLLSVAKTPTHVAVAPLPLRDMIAMHVQVTDEYAADMAKGMRMAIAAQNRVQLVAEVLGTAEDAPVTMADMANMKAKIRYLESDAMIVWRAEAEAKARERAAAEESESAQGPG